MKQPLIALSTILLFSPLASESSAQSQMTCGNAQYQLQQYAAQVNQVANLEYYQGIGQRCYGNQYCMNTLLGQLNAWYQQQASLVNQWYYKISVDCSGQRPDRDSLPGRGAKAGSAEIDEDAIDELEVDREDDTVAIVIPDNPRGFKPRR